MLRGRRTTGVRPISADCRLPETDALRRGRVPINRLARAYPAARRNRVCVIGCGVTAVGRVGGVVRREGRGEKKNVSRGRNSEKPIYFVISNRVGRQIHGYPSDQVSGHVIVVQNSGSRPLYVSDFRYLLDFSRHLFMCFSSICIVEQREGDSTKFVFVITFSLFFSD